MFAYRNGRYIVLISSFLSFHKVPVHVHVCMYVRMYVRMYVYMYVCMVHAHVHVVQLTGCNAPPSGLWASHGLGFH